MVRRAYERAYETLTGRSGSLHDIPPSDEWLSGKTEQDVSVDAESILGQIPSTGDGSI